MMSPQVLLRCVGQAFCTKGVKALLDQIPVAGALFEIAEETWNQIKQHRQDEIIATLHGCANMSDADARKMADQISTQFPQLKPEEQKRLADYLRQIPSAARASLRRPTDPFGRTVPPGLVLSGAAGLLTILPQRLPFFHPGDKPAGIGDWDLVDLLGMGGFGEVWKVQHALTKEVAAMKFCTEPAAKKALVNEAEVIVRVQAAGKHPGIVTLIDTYLNNDPPCLKYEFVEGGDLTGLAHENLTPQRATAIIAELAATVGYFHRLSDSVVHRDLKPANVLVTKDGKLKVADFGIGGIAAQRAANQSRQGTTRDQLLAESVRGACTLLYASPQQKKMLPASPTDDVYALGVIWYQLLKRDFTAEAPTGQKWIDELRQLGVSDTEITLLASCLEANPNHRPNDAKVLANRLSPTTGPTPPMANSWGNMLFMNLVAITLVVVVGFVGWILYERLVKPGLNVPNTAAVRPRGK